MSLSRLRSRAFTLLELIVVIVILGVLAAIALPTFQSVIAKSQDATTKEKLSAIGHDALALYALGGTSMDQAVKDATAETSAAAPGVQAAALVADTVAASLSSAHVVYSVSGTSVGYALRASSGDICFAVVAPGQSASPWCSSYSAGAAADPGGTALAGSSAGASASPVAATYESVVAGDGPTGFWTMDDATGTSSVADSSGNGLDGSDAGRTNTQVAGLTSGAGSKAGSYTGGYTNLPDSALLMPSGGAVTYEVWLKTSSTTTQQGILEHYSNNGLIGASMRLDNTGHVLWAVGNNVSFSYVATSPSSLTAGTAYHLVGTYDGSSLKLYVNGVLVASTAGSVTFGDPGTPLRLGARGNDAGLTFSGTMDDVAVYQKTLSSTQVLAHYNAGK